MNATYATYHIFFEGEPAIPYRAMGHNDKERDERAVYAAAMLANDRPSSAKFRVYETQLSYRRAFGSTWQSAGERADSVAQETN